MDINLEELQKDILELLIRKPVPLTGDEIRFVRKYFELTKLHKKNSEFGKLYHQILPAIFQKKDTMLEPLKIEASEYLATA